MADPVVVVHSEARPVVAVSVVDLVVDLVVAVHSEAHLVVDVVDVVVVVEVSVVVVHSEVGTCVVRMCERDLILKRGIPPMWVKNQILRQKRRE